MPRSGWRVAALLALAAPWAVAQVNPFSIVGRAVLMGAAQSKQEAELAQSRVRAIKGVKSLRAHLRVVPGKG